MFKIEENLFLTHERVKYCDEKENIIRVFPKLNGESLKIKITLSNGITVKPIYFKVPYMDEGVHFLLEKEVPDTGQKEQVFKTDAETTEILTECVGIIERWMEISAVMYQLNAENLNRLFSVVDIPAPEDKTNAKTNMAVNLISRLKEFEEAEDVYKVYEAAIRH